MTETVASIAALNEAGDVTAAALPDPRPLVYVRHEDGGYVGVCRVHGGIALKDTPEDAELAAARHIGRVHLSGEAH